MMNSQTTIETLKLYVLTRETVKLVKMTAWQAIRVQNSLSEGVVKIDNLPDFKPCTFSYATSWRDCKKYTVRCYKTCVGTIIFNV